MFNLTHWPSIFINLLAMYYRVQSRYNITLSTRFGLQFNTGMHIPWIRHWTQTWHAIAWWRHQMETFSALLAICAGNSPVTGEFPAQRPVTHSFDVFLAATKQLNEWYFPSVRLSVRPSVCPSHLFDYVPIFRSSWNFQELLPMTKVMSMQKVKVRGQKSRSQRSWPHLAVSGP